MTCEILCLHCNLNGLAFQQELAYRPDCISSDQNDQFLEYIESFCSSILSNKSIIIFGALILPHINWNVFEINIYDTKQL